MSAQSTSCLPDTEAIAGSTIASRMTPTRWLSCEKSSCITRTTPLLASASMSSTSTE